MKTVSQSAIFEYMEVKDQLDKIKKQEAALRIAILDDLFPAAGEGTLNTIVGDYKVKGTFRNNMTIDRSELDLYKDSMSAEELACIDFKPSLKVANYKKLDDTQRIIIDQCVTVKPGMPAIKIELIDD